MYPSEVLVSRVEGRVPIEACFVVGNFCLVYQAHPLGDRAVGITGVGLADGQVDQGAHGRCATSG